MKKPVIIVQGGQYGSEAKGAIAAYICETEAVDIAIRTGAVNAGHSAFYRGRKFVMQQLPVGWVNPNTQLVIGAGALIHPEILARECKLVTELTGHDITERLMIDTNAGVHNEEHTQRSKDSGRHHTMGATGKGCSEAIIDKIKGRGTGYATYGKMFGIPGGDTAEYLNSQFDKGAKLLIEGTQGTLLDLHTGPYPYVTHKSCLPASWMAECGLSPALPTDIVMVVRTYPIRVAGNSGPMPQEISWPTLAREINTKRLYGTILNRGSIVRESAIEAFEDAVRIAQMGFAYPAGSDGLHQHEWTDADTRLEFKETLSELNAAALRLLPPDTITELSRLFELTTVTKKLRRVARLDMGELKRAAMLCRPHRIALTFMNYMFPQQWFVSADNIQMMDYEMKWVKGVESAAGAPVTMVTYGPGPEHVVRLG